MKRKLKAALGAMILAAPLSAQEKPNIVVIYADDLGYGDVGCYGATKVATPNIDRVASEGIRHTNLHTSSATSTPSRFSLLTGTYAWRQKGTGVAAGDAAMLIKPTVETLPKMLQRAGYNTAVVGKWHLGLGDTSGKQNWNGKISPGANDIGFDYSFIMAATGDRVPCVYIEDGRAVDLDPNDPIEVSYSKSFEGEPTGKNNPELLKMHPSHGHDQALINGISRIGYMRGGKSALWVDEEIGDRITEKAVEFIESSDTSEPIFLFFATNDIHVPRAPHPRFVGASGMGARGDAIVEFDWSVGQVLDALERKGIADNTLVIITSDNGPVVDDGYHDQSVELLGDHKPWGELRGGKYSIFEAGTRVIGIAKWNGVIAAGDSNDAPISQVDLYATLGSIAGAKDLATNDSEDLSSELIGKSSKGRKYLVKHGQTHSITVGDWKYIKPIPGVKYTYNAHVNIELGTSAEPQLYNLKNDLGERVNLANENPKMVEKLSKKLEEIIANKK